MAGVKRMETLGEMEVRRNEPSCLVIENAKPPAIEPCVRLLPNVSAVRPDVEL